MTMTHQRQQYHPQKKTLCVTAQTCISPQQTQHCQSYAGSQYVKGFAAPSLPRRRPSGAARFATRNAFLAQRGTSVNVNRSRVRYGKSAGRGAVVYPQVPNVLR